MAQDLNQPTLFPDPGSGKRGYLYLGISQMRTGLKVGYTTNPRRRGGEYKDFEALCHWPGDPGDETSLHAELEAYRIPGQNEWYWVTREILWFALRQCQKYEFPRGARLVERLLREQFGGEAA